MELKNLFLKTSTSFYRVFKEVSYIYVYLDIFLYIYIYIYIFFFFWGGGLWCFFLDEFSTFFHFTSTGGNTMCVWSPRTRLEKFYLDILLKLLQGSQIQIKYDFLVLTVEFLVKSWEQLPLSLNDDIIKNFVGNFPYLLTHHLLN